MVRNRYILPLVNIVGLVLVLVMNGLANALPINGVTTGGVSDSYGNLFVPAGFTFSIWGVIYLLLTAFAVYQWRAARQANDIFVTHIGPWFFISCLANAGWILAWHYRLLPLSLAIMLVLLASLLTIYLRLGIGMRRATRGQKWLVYVPFSVYLGWITVATIANVSAVLTSIQWGQWGLSSQFWTVAVISVGVLIALAMAFRKGDLFFCLVVVWALLGILLKRMGDTVTPDRAVEIAAIAGMALVGLAVLLLLARKRVYHSIPT
ncbi:MAG: hypothetical protein GX600_06165 [Dehalococcoidia bacterium]|nr:hypothetical protein [Dehalococcoidia bacterium]